MKKITLTICTILFTTVAVFAQVEYSVVKDNPEDVPNLHFYVLPLVLDGYGANVNFGGYLGASFNLNNKAEVEGYYRKAYIDSRMHGEKMQQNESYYGVPANGKTNLRKWGVTGTYFFSKKIDTKESAVTVRSTGSTDYMIEVPAKKYTAFGARFGFNSLLTQIGSLEQDYSFAGHKIDSPSVKFGEWDPGSLNNYQTMMLVNAFSVGISKTYIMDLIVNTKQFGERTSSHRNMWYIDALFAVNMQLDDMLVVRRDQNGTREDVFTLADSKFNPFGLRAGLVRNGNYPRNLFAKLEAGIQPGVSTYYENQLYATVAFGLSFGVKTN